ncbi:MAG: hypothetical protein ACYC0C_12355 [Devosia sp.]
MDGLILTVVDVKGRTTTRRHLERLEEVLASVLDHRQERAERRREHIAELNKRAAETDLRLKRLYDAIETGVADLDDPALKERISGLKAIRDQAQADSERAQAMLESSGQDVSNALSATSAELAQKLPDSAASGRIFVAVAGPPGAGKSTSPKSATV